MDTQYENWLYCHVEAANESEARLCADKLTDVLLSAGIFSRSTQERYWKLPEQYRIAIEINLPIRTLPAIKEVLRILGSGWETRGSEDDCWAIWVQSPDSHFVIPAARWAHFQSFLAVAELGDYVQNYLMRENDPYL